MITQHTLEVPLIELAVSRDTYNFFMSEKNNMTEFHIKHSKSIKKIWEIIISNYFKAGRTYDDASDCFNNIMRGNTINLKRDFGIVIDEDVVQKYLDILWSIRPLARFVYMYAIDEYFSAILNQLIMRCEYNTNYF